MAQILKLAVLFLFLTTAFASTNELVIPLHTTEVTLNPTDIQDLSALFVSRQVNCQLVREQGTLFSLEAAESINYRTPLEIVIKLKNNVRFQDGTLITADDVVANFEHVKKSRVVLRNIFSWVKKVDAKDRSTIIFHLKRPIPQFLRVLSAPNYAIFKRDFLNRAAKNTKLWENPLGCGKYRIIETTSHSIKLSPINNGYPITFIYNKSNQINASEVDNFSLFDLNVSGDASILSKYTKIETLDPTQIYIGLNTNKPLWKRKSNRCNFMNQLSTKKLLAGYVNQGKEANDFFPQGIMGYEMGNSFKTKASLPNTLSHSTNFYPFCISYLSLSIPKQFRPLYYNMIKKVFPNTKETLLLQSKKFGSDFLKQNCDALIMGLKSNYLDGYEFLVIFSDKNANFTGYFNKKLAAKIRQSQTILDPMTRAQKYREIVNKIDELCLVRPLVSIPMRTIYIKKSLTTPGIGIGPLNEYDLSYIR